MITPLTDTELASMYIGTFGSTPGTEAIDLVDGVERWISGRLDHRSAWLIAVEAEKILAQKPAPLPTPEENAAQLDLAEGIGNPAVNIADMSMAEYARRRREFGTAPPDLLTFLSGEG